MKWSRQLVLVRHAESAYNEMNKKMEASPIWKKFLEEFDYNFRSRRVRYAAQKVMEAFALPHSDYETPLSEEGKKQAQRTGIFLRDSLQLPDVVISSPYLRTRSTYEETSGVWPELKKVPFYTEELVVERELGLATRFPNWRLFYVFYPEQRDLYDLQKYYHYRFPQGEHIPDLRRRLRQWAGTLTREFSEKNVLVYTHHLTILGIRANQERLSPEEFVKLDKENPPKNCSITIYEGHPELGKDGKMVLKSYNAVAPGN